MVISVLAIFYILTFLTVISDTPLITLKDDTTTGSHFDYSLDFSSLLKHSDTDSIKFKNELHIFNIETRLYTDQDVLKVNITDKYSNEHDISEYNCKRIQVGATVNTTILKCFGEYVTNYKIVCSDINIFTQDSFTFQLSYPTYNKSSTLVYVKYTLKVAIHNEVVIQAVTALLFDNSLTDNKEPSVNFIINEVSLFYFNSNIKELKDNLARYILTHLFSMYNIQINHKYKEIIDSNKNLYTFLVSFLEHHILVVSITFNENDLNSKNEVVLEIDFKNNTVTELNSNILKGLKSIKSILFTNIEFKLYNNINNKAGLEFYENYVNKHSNKHYKNSNNNLIKALQFETKENNTPEYFIFYNIPDFNLESILKNKYFILLDNNENVFKDKKLVVSIVKSNIDKLEYLFNQDYSKVNVDYETTNQQETVNIVTYEYKLDNLLNQSKYQFKDNLFENLIYSSESFILNNKALFADLNEELDTLFTFSNFLNRIDIYIYFLKSDENELENDISTNYHKLLSELQTKQGVMKHSFLYLSTPFKVSKVMLNKSEIEQFLTLNKELTLEVEYELIEKEKLFEYSYENLSSLTTPTANRLNKEAVLNLKLNEKEYCNNRFVFELKLERELKYDFKLNNENDKNTFLLDIVKRCMISSRLFHLKEDFGDTDIIYKYGEYFSDSIDIAKNTAMTYIFLGVYFIGILLIVGQITFT